MSELKDLPEGWAFIRLGSLATLIGGGTPPRKDAHNFGGDIVWLTPTEIPKDNVTVIIDSREKLTDAGMANSSARWIPENSVLLTSRASIGYVAIASTELTTNQGFASFVLPTEIEPKFLGWWLKYQKGTLEQIAGGTTFKEIEAPLAPTSEQRRIVAVIEQQFSRLDTGVTMLQRVREKLKHYRTTVLKAAVEGRLTDAWREENPDVESAPELLKRILKERRERWERDQFAAYEKKGKKPPKNWRSKYKEPAAPDTEDLSELPERWCWVSIEQLGYVIGGLTKNQKRTSLPLKFPYLRVANALQLESVEEIGVKEEELDRILLEEGDLLVVEGNGSPDQIGRVALWDGSIDPCVHQNHLIKVRFTIRRLGKHVLYWLLSTNGREHIKRVASSTSGLHTLSISKVQALAVPLPPLAEQRDRSRGRASSVHSPGGRSRGGGQSKACRPAAAVHPEAGV